jgi:hypothetical protein
MTEYTDIAYSPLSAGGSMVLLQEQTMSSSATISFTSGIDSTYKEYVFKFNKVSSSVDGGMITINGSIDGGSNYNIAKTTSFTAAQHNEADDDTDIGYNTSKDVAQDTGEAIISYGTGNAADEIVDGYLHLYNPASTTFVKHFIGNANTKHQSDYSIQSLVAGYFNTTSAVNAIQFKMDQGNMDTGTIKLYGVN